MTRRLAIALVSLLALVAFALPAAAKEGATTKFDSLPTDWIAGHTYTLGYTIRMDGVEPYKADRTEIIAGSLDGKTTLAFPGVGDATPGHYTAAVTFPSAGTWTWKVTQGTFFAPMDLGVVTVQPAPVTTSSSGSTGAPAADPVRDALPFAAAGLFALAALTATRVLRRRMPATRTA